MADHDAEELKGTAKELAGKLVGDDEKVEEGQAQQERADAAEDAERLEQQAAPTSARRLLATRASRFATRSDPPRRCFGPVLSVGADACLGWEMAPGEREAPQLPSRSPCAFLSTTTRGLP